MDIHERLISYTEGEELANRITHGLATLVSLPAVVVLIVAAARTGDPFRVVSCAVFGVSVTAFFLVSTLYHTVRSPKVRYVFRILDHAFIYLVIAGTYTPFTLVLLRPAKGWWLFGIVWFLAVAGIIFKAFATHRLRFLAPALYIVLGWLVVVDLESLLTLVSPEGVKLLVAGGLAYTFGIIFYAIDKIPFNHAAWHLFVIAGSTLHYFAVLRAVVPLN